MDMEEVVGIDTNKFNETVARNVAFFRNRQGLTLDALTKLSGIGKTQLSMIENQGYKKIVDINYIRDIARVLRVDEDAITETNHEVSTLISFLNKAVYKVPVTEEVEKSASYLVSVTERRGPKEKTLALMYRGLTNYYRLSYKCCGEACEAVSRFVGWKFDYAASRFMLLYVATTDLKRAV